MLKNINFRNIFHSIWIGAVISFLIQIKLNEPLNISVNILIIIAGGIIGLIIGGVSETITAFLPKKIAGTGLFFLINNLLSIVITVTVLFLITINRNIDLDKQTFVTVIFIAVSVIVIINIFDYIWYKKVNKKLERIQKSYDTMK